MDTKRALHAVAAVVLMILATADAQALFYRTPKTADSCRTFKFTSGNEMVRRWLESTWFGRGVSCPQGQVTNSDGMCVDPASVRNDRCFPRDLTATEVQQRCQSFGQSFLFADPTDCSSYYDCSLGAPYKAKCGPDEMFNDINKTCDLFTTVYCNERPATLTQAHIDIICQLDPTRVIPMDNCNSFYNCSSPPDPQGRFLRYQNECPYFSLFDRETQACKPATEVACNLRPEVKYACSLNQFSCGRGQHCRPCQVDFPDCSSLPDGDQPFPGQEYTPYYARCSQGRSLGKGQCQTTTDNLPRLFDARSLKCEDIREIPRSLGGLADE